MEAENLTKALNVLDEAFKFNGVKHPNILKFHGCYMSESTFSLIEQEAPLENGLNTDDKHEHEEEIIVKATYQVGLITEWYERVTASHFLSHLTQKPQAAALTEIAVTNFVHQMASVLGLMQTKGINHYYIRPETIIIKS